MTTKISLTAPSLSSTSLSSLPTFMLISILTSQESEASIKSDILKSIVIIVSFRISCKLAITKTLIFTKRLDTITFYDTIIFPIQTSTSFRKISTLYDAISTILSIFTL